MAITLVGNGAQNTTGAAAAASLDIAYPGNVTAGSLVAVGGGAWNASAITISAAVKAGSGASVPTLASIIGSTGTAWGGGVGYPFLIYGMVTTGGSLTLTITPSASSYFNCSCDEWAGVYAASPLDVDGGEATGSSDTPTDTLTTLTPNALVLAVVAVDGVVTAWSAGSGYTLVGTGTSGANQPYAYEFQVLAGAAGSQSVTFATGGTVRNYSMVNASFKDAASVAVGLGRRNSSLVLPKPPYQQAYAIGALEDLSI